MNMWKKVIETDDCFGFERIEKGLNIRIEARKNKESWDIFKTYYNNNGMSYTEEYYSQTRDQAQQLIKQLQSRKQPTLEEIQKRILRENKKIGINITRLFRDYNVEKWEFKIDNEDAENFVYMRDSETIMFDIVLNNKYKPKEKEIIETLKRMLGLDNSEFDVKQTVFYYNEKNSGLHKGNKKGMVLGKIDFGFLDEEED